MKAFAWVAPAVLVLAAMSIYPLVFLVLSGFHSSTGEWTLHNFTRMANDRMLAEALLHTGVFVALALALELACGLGLAILIDSLRRGRGLLRTALMVPMLLPPVVAAVVWRLIYNPQFGLLNGSIRALGGDPSPLTWTNGEGGALWSVIAVDVWEWTPFVFLLISAALQSLPQEALEAARVDGASRWRIFLDIELPLLKPVLVLAAMLRGMDLIRVFDQVFILTQGGPGFATETISLYIYRTAFRFFDFGYAAAMSLLLLVIATVLTRGLATPLGPVTFDAAGDLVRPTISVYRISGGRAVFVSQAVVP